MKTSVLLLGMVLSSLLLADTTYVWTGNGGRGDLGKFYFNNSANWQDNAKPPLDQATTYLDLTGLPNEATTLNNDLGDMRLHGFNIETPLLNAAYYLQGGNLTLVGQGGGYDNPDSRRSLTGNFYWQGNVTIEGDYFYFSEGNRSHIYANFSSDETASFCMTGATINLYGDWSGFKGRREFGCNRIDFCESVAAPADVPLYFRDIPGGRTVYFDNNGRIYHSNIIFPFKISSGFTAITADGDSTWDGDFIADSTGLSMTWAVSANRSFIFGGGFTGANITLRMNVYAGAVATFAGTKSFAPRALRLVNNGTLLLNRSFPDLCDHQIYCANDGTIKCGCADAISGNQFLFGEGVSNKGTLDLNGFDQTIPCIRYVGNSGLGWTNQYVTSATPATLRLNGTASSTHFLPAVVQDKATVAVTNCMLVADADAVALSTGTFAAEKDGYLDLSACSAMSGANLSLWTGSTVALQAEAEQVVRILYVNGSALPPGSYSKATLEGLGITVASGVGVCSTDWGEVTPGETFTWKGGTAENAFAEGANWEGGATPEVVTGRSQVDFSAGTAAAYVSEQTTLYKLIFGQDFTLGAVGAGYLELLGGGVELASGQAEIAAPITFAGLPQTWSLASGTQLKLSGLVTSSDTSDPVEIVGSGAADSLVEFAGDNSGLQAPIVVTNGARIKVSSALANRQIAVFGLNPDGNNDPNNSYLQLANGQTLDAPVVYCGSTGPFCARGESVTFGGLFSVIKGTPDPRSTTFDFRVKDSSVYTFKGGIDCGGVYRFIFQLEQGSQAWVREKPIKGWCGTPSNAEINLQTASSAFPMGEVHLAVAGNDWRTLRVMAGGLVCETENALARDGWVLFGRLDYCPQSDGDHMFLDLKGHDQLTSGISTQWNFTEGAKTYDVNRYATVKSATPATVTMDPTVSYSSNESGGKLFGALKYSGQASLRFAPSTSTASTFNLVYQKSDTAGTLEVSSGTLNFARGAGWQGGPVVVNGTGTLGIDAASADTAFGGVLAPVTLTLAEDGKLAIPAGVTVTVRNLVIGDRPMRKGTYGAVGSGASNTEYAAHFTTGGGILRAARSVYPGCRIVIR